MKVFKEIRKPIELSVSLKKLTMKVLIILLVVSLTSASAARPFNDDAANVAKYLDGISSVISQIIQSLQAAIQQVQKQTAEWIREERENIEKSYREAVEEYENFVAKVAHDFYQVINDEIRPCFNGLPEQLEQVRNQTREGIASCRAEGREKYEKIQPEIIEYCNSSRQLIEGARESVKSCFHHESISEAIKCGVQAARNVSESFNLITENNRIVLNIFQTQVREISRETRTCIGNKIANGRNEVRDIFSEVSKCIEEARNSTSTTSSSDATETTAAEE